MNRTLLIGLGCTILTIPSLAAAAPHARPQAEDEFTHAPDDLRVELAPGGRWVVYSAAEAGGRALFSVPLDGRSGPALLGGPLFSPLGEAWRITPDGARVVYLTGALFAAPIDGHGPAVRLDAEEAGGPVLDFALGEGGRVVYRAGPEDRFAGLFSVALDGSGTTALVAPNDTGEVMRAYALAPDGAFVVFLSQHEGGARLYSVPVGGGTPAALGPPDAAVQDFRLGPDGARVFFRAAAGRGDAFELWSAPLDGSRPPLSLSGALPRGRAVQDYGITADGARVAYLAAQGDGRNALFEGTADGAAPPREVARGVSSDFRLLPGGRGVLYTAEREAGAGLALFAATLGGASAPRELSAPLPAGASVGWFEPVGDGERLVYQLQRAGADGRGSELWLVSSTRERRQLAVLADAHGCRVTPDGRRVVYAGAQDTLYALALEGDSAPVALQAGVRSEFTLGPDGGRVLCSSTGSPPVLLGVSLDVPLEGGAPATRLSSTGGGKAAAAELADDSSSRTNLGGTVGFRDFSYGLTGSSTPTGEKPECKLWYTDGFWWGDLYNDATQTHHIYGLRFSDQTWIDTGTVLDPRSSSKGDVLWDEASQKLYLASHIFTTDAQPTPSNWGRLFRYTYTHGSGYLLDEGFPVDITRGNAEALTLAKDSTGRLWATWVESARVMINHSTGVDTQWGLPSVLPVSVTASTLTTDDISAAVSFGTSVGVMWSNQLTGTTYFAVHRDLDPDTTWSEELVVPGVNCTGACSDDLFSLRADTSGNVGAALKTSLTGPDDPLILIAVRSAAGVWRSTPFGRVQDHHTRPLLLFDDKHDRAFVFATHPEAGGAIYFKSTTASAFRFEVGLGTPFLQNTTDLQINNATSAKQNLDSQSDLVVLASDQGSHFYLHNFLDLPPAVSAVAPPHGTSGTLVTLTGTSLRRATSVDFNGSPAPFTVLSNRAIQAIVPAGATTGRVTVTTPFGADSGEAVFSVDGAFSADLGQPNHRFVDLDLSRMMRLPRSSVVITSITQDEPTENRGSNGYDCDADGLGTNMARLRSECMKGGNGRVYRVHFEVLPGSSSGYMSIEVCPEPNGVPAKDDGQRYDSTANCDL